MARIPRKTQKIFAGAASNNGQFGSSQAGTKILSSDLDVLQALAAYGTGWVDAVIGSRKFPALEEFQGLDYINTTQLSYIFQEGIPEYDGGTEYYTNSIVKKAGTYELYGSIVNNNIGNALTDATKWLPLVDLSNITAGRTRLLANANFYVATTGSNSDPGTIGSPWLTLQYAYDYVAKNYDLNGFTATINVADGTYAAGLNATIPAVGGAIHIKGNVSTPANVLLSTGGSAAIAAYNGVQIIVDGGFKLTGSSYLLQARGSGAVVTVSGAMEYGAGGGSLLGQVCAFWGGFVEISANYTISAGAGQHYYAAGNGVIRVSGNTITVSGSPAFSGEFARASSGGAVQCYPVTFSGSATGASTNVSVNGTIDTNGALNIPGSGNTANTGGQYV